MNDIYRNFAWCDAYSDKSFTGIFHEEERWDDAEYFLLEDALYTLCNKQKGVDAIPREIAWPVMRIYSYLSMALGCMLDREDGFDIKTLSREQFCARRERLQLVFEGFFKGEMPDKKCLEY